jgi:ABC-type sugar transport system permease subunit
LTGTEYESFLPTLLKGLETIALEIPMILMFSLFMAVLLNQKMVGRAFFRAMLFLPVILATGIMETVSAQDINEMSSSASIDDGSGQSATENMAYFTSVQSMFQMLDLPVGGGLIKYVSAAVESIFDIVNRSGVQILIFLAGLQSISPAIYESVQIDGATSWETFWKITFPMISPMILVNAVYTVIDSFTTESNPVMQYVMNVYTNSKVYSSAMSWMYFLIVILVIAAVAGIFSAFVFYQRRD